MTIIRVHEHRPYKVGQIISGIEFTKEHLKLLQQTSEVNKTFYSLIHNGIRFCEYVGVLKIGNLIIEVLPKTDGNTYDERIWQRFLIKMLRTAGILDVKDTGFASLNLKSNSILDLYMELFLKEVNYLKKSGLVKKYRKTEGNTFSMKGSIIFNKHIHHNLTNAERFYNRYTIYDADNVYNRILFKAINLISRIGSVSISAIAKSTLFDFPECLDVNVSEALFSQLAFNRKTEDYRKALNMARQLLLNYHPDIRNGTNDVLALMFDMNNLWEKYVAVKLRNELSKQFQMSLLVREQVRNDFWKPEAGQMRVVKPDIVVYDTKDSDQKPLIVLDTKWKQPTNNRPDDGDLKQMLVYNLYTKTMKSALVYPSNNFSPSISGYYQTNGHGSCSLIFLHVELANENLEINLNLLTNYIRSGSK